MARPAKPLEQEETDKKMRKRKLVFIIASILVILIIVGGSIVAHIFYSQLFGNRVEELSEIQFPYLLWHEIDQTKYSREEVRFYSGKNQLQGFIYGGANNKGLVVISHGLGGTADGYFPMIMYFVDQGWRVFAFNNTGVSGSEGKNMRGFPQSVIDLDAALHYVKESNTLKELPVMLVGHSWSGYAVCAVLNYKHQISAVVSFAAFNEGRELLKEVGISSAGIFYYIAHPHFWAIERFRFGNTMNFSAVNGINKTVIPVMIVHCSNDALISPQTTSIYTHRKKITNPYVEIIYLDGDDAAGHEFPFSSKEMRAYRRIANESLQKYWSENENPSKLQWAKEYGFDKFKANELNGELMERINIFFDNAK